MARLGVRRCLIVTDANVVGSGTVGVVQDSLVAAGVSVHVWSGSQAEPTDGSIERAMIELSDIEIDGYVAVGGGSTIDTCKLINLLRSHPAPLTTYLAIPHGEGRPIPGPLAPMIGIPTTAGTGSECTAMAVVDLSDSHTKAAVSHHHLRPVMAIVDPLNTLSCPPQVTASAGYDALVQALESLTCRALGDMPPTTDPATRPVYVGANAVSALWCEESVRLASTHLVHAVEDGLNVGARVGMALAALFSRLGNAGVHLPHANAYAVAAAANAYMPPGFVVDRPLVPHGQSVIATAPAAFDACFTGDPERHLRAASLLGVPADDLAQSPSTAIGEWLRRLVSQTAGPSTLEHFGLEPRSIPSMIDTALTQRRVLACSPIEVTRDVLESIFTRSFASSAASARAEQNVSN
jgi:alcohol dehydrogenase class IV